MSIFDGAIASCAGVTLHRCGRCPARMRHTALGDGRAAEQVRVIVYYYDEMEKQILPSFGYTLRSATAPEATAAGKPRKDERMRGG